MHKVKHSGNGLNKKKIHREQYLCTGMCPRWLVMHGERIPHAWGVTVTLCCVWELRGLCAMSQQGLVSVMGCNSVPPLCYEAPVLLLDGLEFGVWSLDFGVGMEM